MKFIVDTKGVHAQEGVAIAIDNNLLEKCIKIFHKTTLPVCCSHTFKFTGVHLEKKMTEHQSQQRTHIESIGPDKFRKMIAEHAYYKKPKKEVLLPAMK